MATLVYRQICYNKFVFTSQPGMVRSDT